MADAPVALLRPALELAWVVGRESARATPPSPVPGPLRPLLGFARLPDRALQTVRGAVEGDEAFRGRVAALADEERLGRAGWLWLTRPPGWADELEELADEASRAAAEAAGKREERVATKRLATEQAARQRAEDALAAARAALAASEAELGTQRQARTKAERVAGELHLAVEAADRRADAWRADAEAAARGAAARAEASAAELATVLARLADLERRLASADGPPGSAGAAEGSADGSGPSARRVEAWSPAERAAADRVEPAAPVEPGGAAARAVAEAATAAVDLGAALHRAAAALAEVTPLTPPEPAGLAAGHEPAAAGAAAERRRARRAARAARRHPVALPAAVFDDSAEAAEHLVRVPGMTLLVDGYNVTMSTWPGRDIADQRHRLINALAELASRAPVRVRVVFDGPPDEEFPPVPGRARDGARVLFSPPGVDADEVILEALDQLPPSSPALVATDDRRVRREAARRGANIISSRQLLGVLRRGGGHTPRG